MYQFGSKYIHLKDINLKFSDDYIFNYFSFEKNLSFIMFFIYIFQYKNKFCILILQSNANFHVLRTEFIYTTLSFFTYSIKKSFLLVRACQVWIG